MENRFDKYAREWESNPGRIEISEKILKSLLKKVSLNHNMKVLDYGAGTGLISLALSDSVGSVIAMDTSKGMLEVLTEKIAAAKVKNILPVFCNLETQDYSEMFNLIVISMALHHIKDYTKLITKFNHLLSENGSLVIVDLETEDGSFHPDKTGVYYNGFDKRDLKQKLIDVGFCKVSVTRAFGFSRNDKHFDIFIAVSQV